MKTPKFTLKLGLWNVERNREILVTHIFRVSIKWQETYHKSNVSFKCPLENTTYHILATCFSQLLIRTTQHVQGDALHNWKLDIDTHIRESGSQRRKCLRHPGHALRKMHGFRRALIRSYWGKKYELIISRFISLQLTPKAQRVSEHLKIKMTKY